MVDQIDYQEGLEAYPKLHKTMWRLAQKYQTPPAYITGAFSALSPNNDYMGNLRSLITLLHGKEQGVELSDLTVSTYNSCKERAWRFLNGEDFLSVTKGPKTRSFYMNIMNPHNPEPITIDGHMYCIAIGHKLTMLEVAWSKFKYEPVAQMYREFASEKNLLPNQVQGVLWFTWKRIHKVLFNPQLGLFNQGDQWGFEIDVDKVRPFV